MGPGATHVPAPGATHVPAPHTADPWILERYQDQRDRKPHLAGPFLEIIIDRFIERHRLSPGAP
jgi:hypothetical protein